MATLNPTVDVQLPRTGHGSGGPRPPIHEGGDGGRNDGGLPDYAGRLRRARVGLIAGLVAVTMVFVALTSAMIVREGLPTLDSSGSKYVRDWIPVNLPVGLLLINTFLLLVSSLTMELARRRSIRHAALAPVQSIPGVSLGEERGFPWLGSTIVLGFGFLIGQWMAWRELAARGFYMATNPSSSFAYLLTATHAVHLAGGMIALLAAGIMSVFHKSLEQRRIVIDVAGWYWHFMALLWIYVFALLYFAR